ncbi:MAG: hypothetical protein OJF47_003922 [Nitrospira sp.]|jgi:predicted anti-sigma-YlaC factor YlaD|nr:MAG: hypothetical protein OJF47_003922 [Nitrospira sp.]
MNHHPSHEGTAALTCREAAAWTSVYLDACLHDSGQARMTVHVAACAACRAYVEQIRLVREALKGLPYTMPSSELRLFVQQRFAER